MCIVDGSGVRGRDGVVAARAGWRSACGACRRRRSSRSTPRSRGDRDAAFAAMLLDPLASRLDYDAIAAMTDEMLDATAAWLPQFCARLSGLGSLARPDARDCPTRRGDVGGRVGEQVPRGFWVAAREEPERVALIDADGRAWTAGELLAGANRLVHALRARGVQPSTRSPRSRRNSAELFQALLAVFQARLAVRAAQHPPHRGRGRPTSSATPAPRRSSPTRASPTSPRAAADDAGVPPAAGSRSAATIPGFTPLRRRARRPARHARPTDRVAGQFMQYTSGTTGRPKAVQRDLPHVRSRDVGRALYSANLTRYDIEPGGDAVHLVTSPMYHLSPLSFGYFSLHFEHTVVLMERVGRRARAAADRPVPRHRRRDGADPAPPADAAARGRARAVRRVVAAPGDPRGGAVPDRPQAAAVRLARPGDLRVLRRDRGRRHAGHARRTGSRTRARSGGPGSAPT